LTFAAVIPVENVGALVRAAFQPKRVQSFPEVAARDEPAQTTIATATAARPKVRTA
jgi:hypothetical protein